MERYSLYPPRDFIRYFAHGAVHETPSQSYGMSHAIWNHTVLPATRHKWTSRRNPHQTGQYLIYFPGGWKAELTYVTGYIQRQFTRLQSPIQVVTRSSVEQLHSSGRLALPPIDTWKQLNYITLHVYGEGHSATGWSTGGLL